VKQDVKRLYMNLLPYVKITLVEAGPALLGPFDKVLQDYALRLFHRRDIDVRLGTAVIDIGEYQGENGFVFSPARRAMLSDGSSLPFGTMVWSAGLAPRAFTANLDPQIFPRNERTKRLLVDDYLRVIGHEGSIWAIGDAAVNQTGVPLPQLAQVARQEGIYMANVLSGRQREDEKPFEFFSLGSMAFLGDLKGVYDGSSAGPLRDKEKPSSNWMPPALRGLSAFFLWRFAYWGRQTSITNKLLIPMYWFKAFLFGRDTSRY
jgi:NADH dehydrogenase FAD-containing subunit